METEKEFYEYFNHLYELVHSLNKKHYEELNEFLINMEQSIDGDTTFRLIIQMAFRGTQYQLKKCTDEQKLEYDLKLHKELDLMYETITKLAIVCIRKNMPLIIENPYSTTHYLVKYWAIPSKVIDKDRTLRGDYFEKPTQYWFINCEPRYNMILEAYSWNKKKIINNTSSKTERSLISKEYANRFIREFIVDVKE